METEETVREYILVMVVSKIYGVERAFEELADIGYCPALLNDDSGRWAVVFDGAQTIADDDKATDISTSFFVEADDWKDTIRRALLHSLRKY